LPKHQFTFWEAVRDAASRCLCGKWGHRGLASEPAAVVGSLTPHPAKLPFNARLKRQVIKMARGHPNQAMRIALVARCMSPGSYDMFLCASMN